MKNGLKLVIQQVKIKKTMKEIFSNTYLQITLRVIVGGVFVYSAIGKLFAPEEFAKIIYNYDFLPLFFINIFAITLPYILFITGALLIFGVFKKGNSVILISLIVIFLIALIQAYARGLDINCGCFSLYMEAVLYEGQP